MAKPVYKEDELVEQALREALSPRVELARVKAQRDELVVICKELLAHDPDDCECDASVGMVPCPQCAARAAIARAEKAGA